MTTAGRNIVYRQLLCKMPIICVNSANIIHSQFNCRVVTTVLTVRYQ